MVKLFKKILIVIIVSTMLSSTSAQSLLPGEEAATKLADASAPASEVCEYYPYMRSEIPIESTGDLDFVYAYFCSPGFALNWYLANLGIIATDSVVPTSEACMDPATCLPVEGASTGSDPCGLVADLEAQLPSIDRSLLHDCSEPSCDAYQSMYDRLGNRIQPLEAEASRFAGQEFCDRPLAAPDQSPEGPGIQAGLLIDNQGVIIDDGGGETWSETWEDIDRRIAPHIEEVYELYATAATQLAIIDDATTLLHTTEPNPCASACDTSSPQAKATGDWKVTIARDLNALPDPPGGSVSPLDNGITVPLGIPDDGTIYQDTLYELPAYTVDAEQPRGVGERVGRGSACAAAIVGGTMLTIATGGWGGIPATMGVIYTCQDATEGFADGGYYRCYGSQGSVTWGPQSYTGDGDLLDLIPWETSSGHDETTSVDFPFAGHYDPTSYAAGKKTCQDQYSAVVTAIKAAAKEFMTLKGAGTASITFDALGSQSTSSTTGRFLQDLPTATGYPQVSLLGDPVTGAPLLYQQCGNTCPVNLRISVTDCGPTTIVGFGETADWTFEGTGECFKIAVYLGDSPVVAPTAVPLLALDGEFGGAVNENTLGMSFL